MTVTDLHQDKAAEPSEIEKLAERAFHMAEDMKHRPLLVEARAALNEAGILRSRRALDTAPEVVEQCLARVVEAQGAERLAKEAYDAALFDAEYDLDEHFVVESNKTWLVLPCSELGDRHAGLECTECHGTDERRKVMTADEKAKWKARQAKTVPAVQAAAKALLAAEHATALARNEVEVARLRVSACKHDLDAAVATVQTLAAAISPNTTKEQS